VTTPVDGLNVPGGFYVALRCLDLTVGQTTGCIEQIGAAGISKLAANSAEPVDLSFEAIIVGISIGDGESLEV
jgi:hypothetical protein